MKREKDIGTAARIVSATAFLALLTACGGPLVDVNVTVVDQKTSLENQILGSYEELGNDMMLLASVRSVDKDGKLKSLPNIPPAKLKAIRAMQRREFNRDDVQTLKREGIAGEGNDGMLFYFETDRTQKDSRYRDFARNLVKEENEDRLVTLERIVATNENLTPEDLQKVRKISASLNRDNAKSGEKIQLEDGSWTIKK